MYVDVHTYVHIHIIHTYNVHIHAYKHTFTMYIHTYIIMYIHRSESEITGSHRPFSMHVRTMTEQITACKDIMAEYNYYAHSSDHHVDLSTYSPVLMLTSKQDSSLS